MKEYYKQRWHWVFNYTSKNFGYCLLKTLCLVVGLPLYSVAFVLEMVLTGINMIFSWIPILNVVIYVICKSLMIVFGSTFYICILTDIKKYKKETSQEVDYEVLDVDDASDEALPLKAADETVDILDNEKTSEVSDGETIIDEANGEIK